MDGVDVAPVVLIGAVDVLISSPLVGTTSKGVGGLCTVGASCSGEIISILSSTKVNLFSARVIKLLKAPEIGAVISCAPGILVTGASPGGCEVGDKGIEGSTPDGTLKEGGGSVLTAPVTPRSSVDGTDVAELLLDEAMRLLAPLSIYVSSAEDDEVIEAPGSRYAELDVVND